MQNLQMKHLYISHFKGIKEYKLDASGNNVTIKGENASGKTTIFDAFTWLLFGRDSNNRTQFEIKPLDENGRVFQNGVNNEVDGTFLINGTEKQFKRVYREEWKKQRGQTEKTFSGHTTDYIIDGVSVKKTEFEQEVNAIISDDTFKILTNPLYFNEHLDKKQRRQILLNLIDDLGDDEVARNSDMEGINAFIDRIQGKDIERYQQTVRSQRSEINQELERIPVRIDEISRSIPDTSELHENDLRQRKQKLDSLIDEKDQEIRNIRSGGQVSEYQSKISDIDRQLNEIKNNYNLDTDQEIYKQRAALQEKQSNHKIMGDKLAQAQRDKTETEQEVKKINDDVQDLRQQYKDERDKTFDYEPNQCCPTCGQSLPADQIEAAREEAEKQFNDQKADKLNKIMADAGNKKDIADNKQKIIDGAQKTIEDNQASMEKLDQEITKINQKIDDLNAAKGDPTNSKEYQDKQQERDEINQKINSLQANQDQAAQQAQQEMDKLKEQRGSIEQSITTLDQAKQFNERLQELEQQEKDQAQKVADKDQELDLIEGYTRSKTELMERRINNKFNHATFKLFERQLNGGLKEVCETLYNGIPYSGGLNNAARINVGMDILSTLQDHYQVQAPIFIDNRESVTDLVPTDAQVFNLIVDGSVQGLESSID